MDAVDVVNTMFENNASFIQYQLSFLQYSEKERLVIFSRINQISCDA